MSEQNHEFSEVNTDLPFTDDGDQAAGIELSPELAKYGKIADGEDLLEEAEPDKKAETVAGNVALSVLAGAEWAVKKWLGANTGLSDKDKEEWAKKVAPALVKMGVTDYTGFFDRYKVYIVAIVATYNLGEKIADNVAMQLAEKAAEEEKRQQAQQEARQDMPEGLGGYERDLATQGKLMAGS